jgi:hypothetical protein
VESAILEPVRSELLNDEAVERFCSLIREWYCRETETGTCNSSPAAEAIALKIADLEALVAEGPSGAATLGQAIESLRQKRANLQRSTMRRTAVPDVALPAGAPIGRPLQTSMGRFRGAKSRRHERRCAVCLETSPCFRSGAT